MFSSLVVFSYNLVSCVEEWKIFFKKTMKFLLVWLCKLLLMKLSGPRC
jgi:hypothetical protein